MLFNFQELFTSTTDSLQSRNVPVQEITRHLQLLGSVKSTYADSGVPPLRHQLRALNNAKTVDAVMSVVKDYCSFFNYRMLEHIIKKLGTYKDRKNLAKYKAEFKKYAECCVVDGSHSEMYVTLGDSFNDCNLSHLDVFIRNLRNILKIPPSVKLCRIHIGSLKLIFQLPHSIRKNIFPLSPKQKTSLADLGVVELSCGNYKISLDNDELTTPLSYIIILLLCILVSCLCLESIYTEIHQQFQKDTDPMIKFLKSLVWSIFSYRCKYYLTFYGHLLVAIVINLLLSGTFGMSDTSL